MTDVATWLRALLQAVAPDNDEATTGAMALLDAFEASARGDSRRLSRRLKVLQIEFVRLRPSTRTAADVQSDIGKRLQRVKHAFD
jgi:hypothetical protein